MQVAPSPAAEPAQAVQAELSPAGEHTSDEESPKNGPLWLVRLGAKRVRPGPLF